MYQIPLRPWHPTKPGYAEGVNAYQWVFRSSDVLLHELEAGHWVHVDAPGALIAMMAEYF